jgi:hypothetical protein
MPSLKTRRPKTEKTRFGPVNRKVLRRLEDNFRTMDILECLRIADGIGGRTGFDKDSIRNDLHRLHGMAHELINGGFNGAAQRDDETPWELALELSDEISEWIQQLKWVRKRLDALSALAPDDDEDWSDAKDDDEDEDLLDNDLG